MNYVKYEDLFYFLLQVISKLASLQERQLITTKDKLMLKVNDGKVDDEKMAANNSYRPIL